MFLLIPTPPTAPKFQNSFVVAVDEGDRSKDGGWLDKWKPFINPIMHQSIIRRLRQNVFETKHPAEQYL
jgi:hypothetical protein